METVQFSGLIKRNGSGVEVVKEMMVLIIGNSVFE